MSTSNVFYGVRGVSQIKFTMSDSFLVFYDFDILSMIKRKNPFRFYCVILILNLSRLISPTTILVSKVCHVWFLKCIFDFQNLTRLISKIWRVWFLKWHFWFPKFVAFVSQMTLEFDFQNFSISITKWTLMFSKCVEYAVWNACLIVNLFQTDILNKCLISKIRSFDFPNGVSDFENSIMR